MDGHPAGAHGDETGEVEIFRAESVVHPRTHTGPDLAGVATIHEHEGRFMIRDIGVHGAKHADVVDGLGGVGEKLTDFDAALAVLAEFEG